MRPVPLVSIHNISSAQFADDMVLTQHSALPFYAQIKDLLRAKILDGTFPPNQKLASESELMAHFGVSRITVRQALNELQNEGLIFSDSWQRYFCQQAQGISRPDALARLW